MPRLPCASLLALTLLPGCFSPAFDDGQFTCPTGECPDGFDCVDGTCVHRADPGFDAGGSTDAPAPPDAGPGSPDANATDAAPPRAAAVFLYDVESGDWSEQPASEFFAGPAAPAPDSVQTAWSHCRPGDMLCFGTATAWHCTEDLGASWITNSWLSIDPALAATPPTYTTAWDNYSGFLDRVEFNRAAAWWRFRFFGAPRDGGMGVAQWTLNLVAWSGAPGDADHDTEWAAEPDAPPSAAAIVADYGIDTTWYLWTADGTEYSLGEAGWAAPGPAPYLASTTAPPAGSIEAATYCNKQLLVVTHAE